jgi:lipopolysaccharide assembly protein A
MNFLKTLFWIVLSAVVVLFSINNWLPVTVSLWGGLEADMKKPIFALFFFLLGFVPTIVYYRTKAWRLSKRLNTVSRELADERGMKKFRAPEPAGGGPAPTGDELTLDTPAPDGPRS